MADDDDVAAGLSELERKLEALEQELHGGRRVPGAANGGAESTSADPAAGSGGSPFAAALGAPAGPSANPDASHAFVAAPPPAPRPVLASPPSAESPGAPFDAPDQPRGGSSDTARLVGDARAELGGLGAHLDELARFRDQLDRSAQELLAEYDRLLTGLRAAAEIEEAAGAVGGGLDAMVLDGMLAIDAGPFDDIATLADFERALAGLPGVRDVHVRTFERSHALIDVILGEPLALGTALRRSSAFDFAVTRAAPGHVTIAVG